MHNCILDLADSGSVCREVRDRPVFLKDEYPVVAGLMKGSLHGPKGHQERR